MTEGFSRAIFANGPKDEQGRPLCPVCRKPFSEHKFEEDKSCHDKEQAQVALLLCAICEKPFGEHTPAGIRACANKQRDIKLKDVRCPICNKLVLEHSHAQGVACTEKAQAAKHEQGRRDNTHRNEA